MFFLKPKQRSGEILPPPPPFEEEELDKRLEEKPKFFDKILKPKADVETFPEEAELGELLEDLGKEPKARKPLMKKDRLEKQSTKFQAKQAKDKKTKKNKRTAEKQEIGADDFEIDNLKFDMPIKSGGSSKKDVSLPDTLEEFGVEGIEADLGKDNGFGEFLEQEAKTKPKELQEAEDEIKSAIEKIKGKDKIGIFHKLFGKKEKISKEAEEAQLVPEFPESLDGGEVSVIKDSISKTRDALMRFDLEAAKRNYIAIMKLYDKISPEEKAEVYNDIKELYFERKSAEELRA